jgi:hypothetical protein
MLTTYANLGPCTLASPCLTNVYKPATSIPLSLKVDSFTHVQQRSAGLKPVVATTVAAFLLTSCAPPPPSSPSVPQETSGERVPATPHSTPTPFGGSGLEPDPGSNNSK